MAGAVECREIHDTHRDLALEIHLHPPPQRATVPAPLLQPDYRAPDGALLAFALFALCRSTPPAFTWRLPIPSSSCDSVMYC